ncbi:hypothetical protein HUN39_14265 [Methylocystis sp. FS]|uniref:hypothetical protein n=1 Tax=Methylocystis silviterrae TaxID=2743612 RepID=UPI0015835E67|nr:hypothetical protein [Methylocystis silviterrae]NUJ81177.1 hypothetical protein [Methylocystis silviterrae]
MAALNIFDQFIEDLAHGVHNFSAHTLKIYLTDAAPSASADAVKADLAEIAAGNGYTSGGNACALVSSGQTAGAYALVLADPAQWIASGGSIGPFRYAVLYNDSAPGDPLIGWWDAGGEMTINAGFYFSVDLDTINIDLSARFETVLRLSAQFS